MVSTVVSRSFLRLHSLREFRDGMEMVSLDQTESKLGVESTTSGKIIVEQDTFRSTDFLSTIQ